MAAEIVTLKEVKFVADAFGDAAKYDAMAAAKQEIKKAAMMGVFERLLGIKTSEQLAALSPDEIRKILKKRLKRGDVELVDITFEQLVDQVIKQSQCRRNVAWKDEFVKALGESKATEITNAAAPSYSYKFVSP